MWDRIKLILTGDGSLVITKYYKDGSKKTVLVSPEHFVIDKLTGYLSTLSGKRIFDLIVEEGWLGPVELSLKG